MTSNEHWDTRVERAEDDFGLALDRVDGEQLELQNGRPDAYKALWSHSHDVTLAGGLEGRSRRDGST